MIQEILIQYGYHKFLQILIGFKYGEKIQQLLVHVHMLVVITYPLIIILVSLIILIKFVYYLLILKFLILESLMIWLGIEPQEILEQTLAVMLTLYGLLYMLMVRMLHKICIVKLHYQILNGVQLVKYRKELELYIYPLKMMKYTENQMQQLIILIISMFM